MSNLIVRGLRRAWTTAPRDFVRQARLKLKGGPATPLERFEATPNARDWTRHWSNFTRIELAARHRLEGWPPFAFEGEVFLEIGCGLTGGLTPVALFLGARRALGIEPQWQPAVLGLAEARDGYFRPMWSMLCSVYGERTSFERFMARLHDDLEVHDGPLETAGLAADVGLVWSLSCLEHVHDLDGALQALAKACRDDCRQVHVVDFGNHRSKETPFQPLYDMPPERHRAAYGDHVNRLRHPDVLRLFERAGLPPRHLVVDRRSLDRVDVDPYWRRYSEGDLGIRVAAYFVGPS